MPWIVSEFGPQFFYHKVRGSWLWERIARDWRVIESQSLAIRPKGKIVGKFVVFKPLIFRIVRVIVVWQMLQSMNDSPTFCHYLLHSMISQSHAISSERPIGVNLAQHEPRGRFWNLIKFIKTMYSSPYQTKSRQTVPVFRAAIAAQFGSGRLSNCAAIPENPFGMLYQYLKSR